MARHGATGPDDRLAAPVRCLRFGELPGLPDRCGLRRAVDPHRPGHPGRALREHLGRDGAGPDDGHRPGGAYRRPVHDRPGQPHRRPLRDRHRRRRPHRALRLHHRPEPRLREPRRSGPSPVAERRPGPHRHRQLAGDRGGGPSGEPPGSERGGGGRRGRAGHLSRPLRDRRGAGPDRPPLRPRVGLDRGTTGAGVGAHGQSFPGRLRVRVGIGREHGPDRRGGGFDRPRGDV